MKALRRVMFGSGQLADDLRATLTQEGLVLLEEALPGSVTYHDYVGPDLQGERGYSSWKKEPTSGAIAITHGRLVVWLGRHKHIDMPRTGPFRDGIRVTIPKPDHIRFSYDAGRFRRDRSGQVDITLRTPNAARIDALLAGDRGL